MNVTVRDLIRANGSDVPRKPRPAIGLTTLLRDYFSNHTEARLTTEEASMHISARTNGFTDKEVGSALCRLASEKCDYYLVRVGFGRGVRYKLSDKHGGKEEVVMVPALSPLESLKKANQEATELLNKLLAEKDSLTAKYFKDIAPIEEQIAELREALKIT